MGTREGGGGEKEEGVYTGVKIHGYVGEVELRDGVVCAFEIGVVRVGALRHV
jgi:hypothetical protein